MQHSSQSQHNIPVSTESLVEELKAIYQQTIEYERGQLNELLNLQKLFNNLLSTTPLTKQQTNKSKLTQPEEKKEFNIEKIGLKIEQIIEQTDDIILVQTQQVNSKKPPLLVPISAKTKKEPIKTNSNKPQPTVDKKPPLPTVNRTNDTRMGSSLKYVPPRNKNEVTGKVTQTKILTQQKVFKPQLTMKTTTTIKQLPTVSSSSSIQKRPTLLQKQPTTAQTSSSTLAHQQDSNSISEYKNLRAVTKASKLKQFSKPIEQILEQKNKKKQSSKKRINFKQLLEKYESEEMGHRGLEEKRRMQFIKKFNNFGLSLNASGANDITHSCLKRAWKNYPAIFEFNALLESVQESVAAIEQQYNNDLRTDPKEAYRVQYKLKSMQRELNKIMQTTQIQVPDKLQLTFKPLAQKQQKKPTNLQMQKVNLNSFYQNLQLMLRQLQENESLGSDDLSLLRVIAEIGLHNGKKAPLIVKTAEFQEWKNSYEDVNGPVSQL